MVVVGNVHHRRGLPAVKGPTEPVAPVSDQADSKESRVALAGAQPQYLPRVPSAGRPGGRAAIGSRLVARTPTPARPRGAAHGAATSP